MIVPQNGRYWTLQCQPQQYTLRDLLQDVSLALGILIAIHTLTR